jgi:hypothetical protein
MLGSILLLLFIVYLIRKRKLRVEYAILWIIVFFVFFMISIFRRSIEIISSFLGIYYAPASLFIILIVGLFLLMLHFSIIISDLKKKVNKLAVNVAFLEEEIGLLKNQNKEKE